MITTMNIQTFCKLMNDIMKAYCSNKASQYVSHCIDIVNKRIEITYFIIGDNELGTYYVSFDEMGEFVHNPKYEHEDFPDAWHYFITNREMNINL